MLTVLTWFWSQPNGRAKYTAAHVNIWADMVRRNLAMPHRIACVTSQPAGLDASIDIIEPPGDFEDVRLPTWDEGKGLPQCLRRLAMFRPDAAGIFGKRFVAMDLDCVVTGALDPLFDRPEDFVIYRGTAEPRPYNGSMLMMTAGARPQVFTEFTPEGAAEAGRLFIGSDQAWISHKLGRGEATWGVEHGVYWRSGGHRQFGSEPSRLVFFPGNVKPWDALRDPMIATHYRRSPQGRCLILGYARSVWREAEAALRESEFDAVIASPEAAEHWPGDVLAVAHDDDEADRLAKMHGFDEVTWCGRTEEAA